MATVTGMTADAMAEIRDTTVVNGDIDEDGHLILIQFDGTNIDAGSIRGTFDAATETTAGIVELATTVEAAAGVDTSRAITAAGLTAFFAGASVPDASDTVKGKVELATSAETITGSDSVRAVTPQGLHSKVASDTVIGLVELATSAETITGSDTARAVTPAGLAAKTASATAQGIVELATDAETTTGTDTARATTPANVAAAITARVASSTAAGIVELATDAETTTGTDTVRATTPANVAAAITARAATTSAPGIVELATTGEATAESDATRAVTPAGLADRAKLASPTFTGTVTTDKLVVGGSLVVSADTLTDAATIAVDAALGNVFTVTLGGNRTLGNPTNATNGQKILFRIRQDGTGTRTLALDTKYRLGTSITSTTLTTTAAKTDYLGVIYHSTDDKFDVIAFVKGF
jgi:hypothetical protein